MKEYKKERWREERAFRQIERAMRSNRGSWVHAELCMMDRDDVRRLHASWDPDRELECFRRGPWVYDDACEDVLHA